MIIATDINFDSRWYDSIPNLIHDIHNGNLSNIDSLCIWDLNITIPDMKLLCNYLQNDRSISELDFSGSNIEDESIEILASMLKNHSYVQRLILFDINMTNIGAMHIADALRTNRSLKDLDIKQNHDTAGNGIVSIFQSLQYNKSLKSIEFDLNGLSANDLDSIILSVNNNNIIRSILPRNLSHRRSVIPDQFRNITDQIQSIRAIQLRNINFHNESMNIFGELWHQMTDDQRASIISSSDYSAIPMLARLKYEVEEKDMDRLYYDYLPQDTDLHAQYFELYRGDILKEIITNPNHASQVKKIKDRFESIGLDNDYYIDHYMKFISDFAQENNISLIVDDIISELPYIIYHIKNNDETNILNTKQLEDLVKESLKICIPHCNSVLFKYNHEKRRESLIAHIKELVIAEKTLMFKKAQDESEKIMLQKMAEVDQKRAPILKRKNSSDDERGERYKRTRNSSMSTIR